LQHILVRTALEQIGQSCRGRQPWQASDQAIHCDHRPLVLQRSQTAVHFADIVSALDLETRPTDDTSILDAAMQEVIAALLITNASEAEPHLMYFTRKASASLGRAVSDEEARSWLRRHFGEPSRTSSEVQTASYQEVELLSEEWTALTTPTYADSSTVPLIVKRDEAAGELPALGLSGIYLIERLREVRALRGFRRLRPDAELVRPDLGMSPPQRWLPAIEVFGEGIFLEFDHDAVSTWESGQADALRRRLARIEERLAAGDRPTKRFSHLASLAARFILVHTFSHLFMRQLCYECGYGGAALRERLYVFEDRLGLLIYTADGDSEGSLGGLVRQGRDDRIWPTIQSALERAAWCSNDPICREVSEHGFEKLNLAACHACALVPETSCTHLNTLLDRQLIIGDETSGVSGFFAHHLSVTSG
jgi:hypothetical protein